jgi:hypothetical protein
MQIWNKNKKGKTFWSYFKLQNQGNNQLYMQICIINKGNNKITEQSYKGKVKTHKYINRQNQSTTGKL